MTMSRLGFFIRTRSHSASLENPLVDIPNVSRHAVRLKLPLKDLRHSQPSKGFPTLESPSRVLWIVSEGICAVRIPYLLQCTWDLYSRDCSKVLVSPANLSCNWAKQGLSNSRCCRNPIYYMYCCQSMRFEQHKLFKNPRLARQLMSFGQNGIFPTDSAVKIPYTGCQCVYTRPCYEATDLEM